VSQIAKAAHTSSLRERRQRRHRHLLFLCETSEKRLHELIKVLIKDPFSDAKITALIEDGGRIVNISTGLERFTLLDYSASSGTTCPLPFGGGLRR